MTLSNNNRRERGAQMKRDRIERQGNVARRFPWLMPAIVALAILLVVAGIIAAAALGKLF